MSWSGSVADIRQGNESGSGVMRGQAEGTTTTTTAPKTDAAPVSQPSSELLYDIILLQEQPAEDGRRPAILADEPSSGVEQAMVDIVERIERRLPENIRREIERRRTVSEALPPDFLLQQLEREVSPKTDRRDRDRERERDARERDRERERGARDDDRPMVGSDDYYDYSDDLDEFDWNDYTEFGLSVGYGELTEMMHEMEALIADVRNGRLPKAVGTEPNNNNNSSGGRGPLELNSLDEPRTLRNKSGTQAFYEQLSAGVNANKKLFTDSNDHRDRKAMDDTERGSMNHSGGLIDGEDANGSQRRRSTAGNDFDDERKREKERNRRDDGHRDTRRSEKRNNRDKDKKDIDRDRHDRDRERGDRNKERIGHRDRDTYRSDRRDRDRDRERERERERDGSRDREYRDREWDRDRYRERDYSRERDNYRERDRDRDRDYRDRDRERERERERETRDDDDPDRSRIFDYEHRRRDFAEESNEDREPGGDMRSSKRTRTRVGRDTMRFYGDLSAGALTALMNSESESKEKESPQEERGASIGPVRREARRSMSHSHGMPTRRSVDFSHIVGPDTPLFLSNDDMSLRDTSFEERRRPSGSSTDLSRNRSKTQNESGRKEAVLVSPRLASPSDSSALRSLLTESDKITPRYSEEEELESGKRTVFPCISGNAFARPLEEIMAMQEGVVDIDIPLILVVLTQTILELGGPDKEGLFRISGNKSQMDEVKEALMRGEYNIPDTSPHNVAGLLKEWLKSLPSPLIPREFYQRCVEAQTPGESMRVVEDIPSLNRRVLLYVLEFIARHVLPPEVQKVTRMDAKSVAMAFAACIMVSPSSTDMSSMMKEIQSQIRFVSNLFLAINPEIASAVAEGSLVGTKDDGQPSSSSVTSNPTSTKPKMASRMQMSILKKMKKAAASEKDKEKEKAAA